MTHPNAQGLLKTQDDWDKLIQVFNPQEVLIGERAHEFYTEREDSPATAITASYRRTRTSQNSPVTLLVGHRGSGKSSLLMKLVQHFAADYFVVYFDTEANLDKNKLNQVDILYVIGLAVHNAARKENLAPDDKLLEGLNDALFALTRTVTEKPLAQSVNPVELAQGVLVSTARMLASSAGEKMAEALLKPFVISAGISEEHVRKREVEIELPKLVNAVNLIIGDVENKVSKPPLIIVDGLDKIQRQEQADLIYLQSRSLLDLVCPTIYTVPMLVSIKPEFNYLADDCDIRLLPNIATYSRMDESLPDTDGCKTLQEIIHKRIHAVGFTENDVFEKGVADYLIRQSGGVLRPLIQLVRETCNIAEQQQATQLTMTAAQAAVKQRVITMTRGLTWEGREELKRVHEKKSTFDTPVCRTLLQSLMIVAYINGETWYDAHPLLWNSLRAD